MAIYTVNESQRKAAKAAGILYLFTILIANLTEFYVRGCLIVRGDALHTVGNIAAHEQLFRIGIAGDLVMLAASVMLVVALYGILKPVNRTLALLAAFWRLVECAIAAATVGTDFAAVHSLTSSNSLPALNTEQLQSLARLLISLDAGGNRVAALFFGLGSTMFCYLWFKSRYIPRLLAALGILASLVPTLVPLSTIVFSSLADAPLRRARSGIPIAIFEVIVGLWLLIKGINAPTPTKSSTSYGPSSSAT
ncbi:MAG: DUF4386 domain-containing protein [Acidobacteriia bacterium]|nr:DUF4386 domain-containing protein [Terriglobia bacterium]